MRPTTVTKLSLADFARILGIHPLHVAQVSIPNPRSTSICDSTFFQYPWQDADKVGRDEILQAIAEAESLVEGYLKYRLAPSWEVDEWRKTEQPAPPELVRIGNWDVRYFRQMVKANWGWFITGGVRAESAIELAAAVVYSDEDNDGYFETATVTTTVVDSQDPCEVHLYYPGHNGEDEWEIRPIKVTISGALATITFHRELAVKSEFLDAFFPEPVDGLVDANFLDTVDVYRVYNDPSTQATMVWEPTGTCNCGLDGCANCSYSVQTACTYLRDNPKLSLVVYSPADWDSTNLVFTPTLQNVARMPDMVRLYYQSGFRDKRKSCTNEMDDQWKRVIAHFAASKLDRPPCDCSATEWEYWREDMSLLRGSDDSGSQKGIYHLGGGNARPGPIENPFGARRGAIEAWYRVARNGIGEMAMA